MADFRTTLRRIEKSPWYVGAQKNRVRYSGKSGDSQGTDSAQHATHTPTQNSSVGALKRKRSPC